MGSQSTALWCSLVDGTAATPIEAHFNYWRIAGNGASNRDFLDVGILIYEPIALRSVSIFIPHPLHPDDIEDLGHRFSPAVAQGIFNEPLDCMQPAEQRWIDLQRQGGGLRCRVYILDPQDIDLDVGQDGSIITIKPHALENARVGLAGDGKLYFRLRIFTGGKSGNPFVTVVNPSDRSFQSGYDEIEYVAFSLNEARTLPRRIETMMQREAGKAKIVLLAFLTAVPVVSELATSSAQFHKSRLLERTIWDAYVSGGIPDGMMVYHWRKDSVEGLENFSAFVKLRTRRSGRGILIRYLLIAFLFGVLGNLAASKMESAWSKWQIDKAASHSIIEEQRADQPANLAHGKKK